MDSDKLLAKWDAYITKMKKEILYDIIGITLMILIILYYMPF